MYVNMSGIMMHVTLVTLIRGMATSRSYSCTVFSGKSSVMTSPCRLASKGPLLLWKVIVWFVFPVDKNNGKSPWDGLRQRPLYQIHHISLILSSFLASLQTWLRPRKPIWFSTCLLARKKKECNRHCLYKDQNTNTLRTHEKIKY